MRALGDRMTHFRLVSGMAKATATDLVQAWATGDLGPDDWAAMVETCRGCTASRDCAQQLARGPQWRAAPDACLNRRRFTALAQLARGRATA